VRLSLWLVLCSLLALFLGLTKRRAELSVSASPRSDSAVLGGYTVALVEQLVAIAAAWTIGAFPLHLHGHRLFAARIEHHA
jgi:hypothetical protein